jgi:RNA polymerase sigma-70 factor (ECF subfamily)
MIPPETTPHTPLSLLDRLRFEKHDRDWETFLTVYDGLIAMWLHRAGVMATDVDDLKQEILMALVRAVPLFEHNGHRGAFRKWLKTLVTQRVLHYFRGHRRLEKRMAPFALNADTCAVEDRMLRDSWEREHDEHVLKALLSVVQVHFTSTTWSAFRRQFFDQRPVEDVASELGISENAALVAKSRVLRRLREEAAGIVD